MNAIDKFDNAVQSYLNDAKYRGVSQATLNNYTVRLALFREFWFDTTGGKADPTTKDVENWRNSLLDSGKKPSTVAQYLMEVSYFYNYATDSDVYTGECYKKNIVNKRMLPKVQKKPYDMLLSDDEVAKLWDRNSYTSLKNYAIVMVLLCTKIRNKELLALTLDDIDFENEEIYIRHGKGDKFRIVDFDKMAQSAVKLYLEKGLHPKDLSGGKPLFGTMASHTFGCGRNNHEEWHTYSSQGLSALVERQVKAITGVGSIRTHDLRHIGSRIALNSRTVSMEELQAELGHSSMNTTQIYSGRLILSKRNKESVNRLLEEKELQLRENERELGVM